MKDFSMNATTSLSPESLKTLENEAIAQLNACSNLAELEHAKVELLGRSGTLTLLKRGLKDVPAEDRPAVGALLNALSQAVESVHDEIKARLDADALNAQLREETIDVTLPGRVLPVGKVHPLSQITEDVCRLFEGMGFSVLDDNACPEVETEFFNFEALNFPADHPARDMQDTYYTEVASHVLLRSQTSNAQIRHMSQHKPPIRVIAPGRVYRNEEVSSRKYVLFHQIEGLYVDKNVTFADLKGTLNAFITELFGGNERPTRFRPSYFPFTEPSAEVDVQCLFCQGDGCKVCGHSGWLEILGAGMVHPNVLENCGIDSKVYQGFAFGMGVERLAMLRDAIDDIRIFYTNDQRFLKQFKPKY
jgi:phenylalanyl-tRNA synthetase alpha chain